MSNHGSNSERIELLLKILSQPHLHKLFQKKKEKRHFAPFLQAMLYKDLILASLVEPNTYFTGHAQLDFPLLLQYNFSMNDASHLGVPLEGELIFMDGNSNSLSAYKKNNHQVSSSEGEEGTLAVAPLITVGEYILMDSELI